jgi:hypothetical protein
MNSVSITTNPIAVWLEPRRVFRHARLCHDGRDPSSSEQAIAQKNKPGGNQTASRLVRWSIQEIRRVAHRLAQRRINPAFVIAWSFWRRADRAAVQNLHLKQKSQL